MHCRLCVLVFLQQRLYFIRQLVIQDYSFLLQPFQWGQVSTCSVWGADVLLRLAAAVGLQQLTHFKGNNATRPGF